MPTIRKEAVNEQYGLTAGNRPAGKRQAAARPVRHYPGLRGYALLRLAEGRGGTLPVLRGNGPAFGRLRRVPEREYARRRMDRRGCGHLPQLAYPVLGRNPLRAQRSAAGRVRGRQHDPGPYGGSGLQGDHLPQTARTVRGYPADRLQIRGGRPADHRVHPGMGRIRGHVHQRDDREEPDLRLFRRGRL